MAAHIRGGGRPGTGLTNWLLSLSTINEPQLHRAQLSIAATGSAGGL